MIRKQNVWEAKRVSNYSISQTLISAYSFTGTSTSAHIIKSGTYAINQYSSNTILVSFSVNS